MIKIVFTNSISSVICVRIGFKLTESSEKVQGNFEKSARRKEGISHKHGLLNLLDMGKLRIEDNKKNGSGKIASWVEDYDTFYEHFLTSHKQIRDHSPHIEVILEQFLLCLVSTPDVVAPALVGHQLPVGLDHHCVEVLNPVDDVRGHGVAGSQRQCVSHQALQLLKVLKQELKYVAIVCKKIFYFQVTAGPTLPPPSGRTPWHKSKEQHKFRDSYSGLGREWCRPMRGSGG